MTIQLYPALENVINISLYSKCKVLENCISLLHLSNSTPYKLPTHVFCSWILVKYTVNPRVPVLKLRASNPLIEPGLNSGRTSLTVDGTALWVESGGGYWLVKPYEILIGGILCHIWDIFQRRVISTESMFSIVILPINSTLKEVFYQLPPCKAYLSCYINMWIYQ